MRINKSLKIWLFYTGCFAIVIIGVFLLPMLHGKSLIISDDSLANYYELLPLRKALLKDIVKGLVHEHRLVWPVVSYNLTGDNILSVFIGNELLDWIICLFPSSCYEFLYSFHIIIRLYLSGVAFCLFCKNRGVDYRVSVLGALAYISSAYLLTASVSQPPFLSMTYLLPLMIWGLEDYVYRDKKARILVFATCYSFVNSVYLTYYLMVGVGIYTLFLILKSRKLSKFFGIIVKILVGFGLSAPISFPQIYGIISSERIGMGMKTSISGYGIRSILDQIIHFFTFYSGGGWNEIGYSIIGLFPFLILVYRRKATAWLYIISYSLLLIPLWGRIAGGGMANNRWSFFIPFLWSVIIVEYLTETIECEKKEQIFLVLCSALLIATMLISNFVLPQTKREYWSVLLIVIYVVVFAVIWQFKVSRAFFFIMYTMVVLCCFLNGFLKYKEGQDSLFLEAGTANDSIYSYNDFASTLVDDDSFFRIDKAPYMDELSCNLPFWFGYNGTSSFSNLLNSKAIQYFRDSGNTGLLQINKYTALGGKASDEALANVKYFICSEDEKNTVPLGFSFMTRNNNGSLVYKNDNVLPIAFLYHDTISYEDYMSMSYASKQKTILQKMVVSDDRKVGAVATDEILGDKSTNESIPLNITESQGIELEYGKWIIKSNDSMLAINPVTEVEGEIYVELIGIDNNNESNCSISVYSEGSKTDVISYGKNGKRSNQQKSFCFRLARDPKVDEDIIINIKKGSGIKIDEIKVELRELNTYINDITALNNAALDKVVFNTTGFSGVINNTSSNPEYLFFSIPYSKGWECTVDGIKSDLISANTMYMATKVDSGMHNIEMSFHPYGMRAGLIVFVILCVGMLAKAVIRLSGLKCLFA